MKGDNRMTTREATVDTGTKNELMNRGRAEALASFRNLVLKPGFYLLGMKPSK